MMPYYEFHYLISDLIEYLKEKNKAEQGQKDQAGDMMGNMKMPNFKMPNITMPKL